MSTQPMKNNSKMLYLQAKNHFEKAKAAFEDGTIKTEVNLIQNVFRSFEEFFLSVGKPNMIPRYAPEQGPPWSEDYNDMMDEIKQDLETLFEEIDAISFSLFTDFNHNMVQHEILSKQFEKITDKMRNLELYTGVEKGVFQFGSDNFLNKDRIDYDRISGVPLEITNGVISLPIRSRENISPESEISIITGNSEKGNYILGTESNGFPGNNTEIHTIRDGILTTNNYMVTFIGEQNNHGNYAAVLDENPNTWFEYEKVNIRDHDKVKVAKNIGWDYQVHENTTIQWASDPSSGVLKLHMQVRLPEEKIINQINVNMYTPPSYGAKTAIVRDILVTDGKTPPQSVLPSFRNESDYSFNFEPRPAKLVSILFEQPNKYMTDIGHVYYDKQSDKRSADNYAMDAANKQHSHAVRVEGPLISLEDLGVEVNVNDTTIEATYPLLSTSNLDEINMNSIVSSLAGNLNEQNVDIGIEKFEGWRWAIGIRDIEIYSCEYEEEGELVTKPFYFKKPIDKITLDIDELIPDPLLADITTKYDYLKYYVSIDDGAQWHPITPMNHQIISDDQPPKIYTVQTIENANQQLDDKRGYIESEYPVYSLRLKVIGSRPSDEVYMMARSNIDMTATKRLSPFLKAYQLQVTTEYDPFESEESHLLLGDYGDLPEDIECDPDDPESGCYEPPIIDEPNPVVITIDNRPDNDNVYKICDNEDLLIEGNAKSKHNLKRITVYFDDSEIDFIDVPIDIGDTNNTPYKFTITDFIVNAYYNIEDIFEVKVVAEDMKGNKSNDYFYLKMVLCEEQSSITITVDELTPDICDCTDLIIRGSVESKEIIHSLALKINGVLINTNDLGVPPPNNPCKPTENLKVNVNQSLEYCYSENGISIKGNAESEYAIQKIIFRANGTIIQEEFFNETITDYKFDWTYNGSVGEKVFFQIEVISALNGKTKEVSWSSIITDCASLLGVKSFSTLSESTFTYFDWEIPYWKLIELGLVKGPRYNIEIIAYGSKTEKRYEGMFYLRDCPDQEDVECWKTESISVAYYNPLEDAIHTETIPVDNLPYHLDNGVGVIANVCLSSEENSGPIIQIIGGKDQSDFSFQVWAVGVNYYIDNERKSLRTKWSSHVYKHSEGVLNPELMTGDPNLKSSRSWISAIKNNGDYSKAPTLTRMHDYVIFYISEEYASMQCWESNVCNPDAPPLMPVLPDPANCYEVTALVMQYYDADAKELKIARASINQGPHATYLLAPGLEVKLAWSESLNAVAVELVEALDEHNLLITAIGVLYRDENRLAKTAWSSSVRWQTQRAQNLDFAIGGKKELDPESIPWIQNGSVDYTQATYVGKRGDIAAFQIDEEFTSYFCIIPPQPKIEVDIDEPGIRFTDIQACSFDETIQFETTIVDNVLIRNYEYQLFLNDQPYGDKESFEVPPDTKDFVIDPIIYFNDLQAGDKITFKVKVWNQFNVISESEITVIVENCDDGPPDILVFEPDIEENGDGRYCYSDLEGDFIPISFHARDDRALYEWTIELDGVVVESAEYTDQTADTGELSFNFPIQRPDPIEVEYGTGGKLKADIGFVFDTSGSMGPYIENVRTNLEKFKQDLIAQGIDAYMGYVDSNHTHSLMHQQLIPAAEFNLDKVDINTGGWEGLRWEQLTSTSQGGRFFVSNFRPGSTRFIIAVTDTSVDRTLSQSTIDLFKRDEIKVSFVQIPGKEIDYQIIAAETGGHLYNILNKEFSKEMKTLADDIITDTVKGVSYYPDHTYTFTAKVKDQAGNETIETITLDFTDCTPMAALNGTVQVDAKATHYYGEPVNMGNFMEEWTQWHNSPSAPGNWTTVSNGGRIELTNSVNQGAYSGWYNPNHINEADYLIEYTYQARGGDDDVIGSFFRVQRDNNKNITGFYSIEHDGNGSWVNGGGFRILKHTVNGTTTNKTVLAGDAAVGWTLGAHRVYKVRATLEGNKFTAQLYGDETLNRDTSVPVGPFNWKLLTTIVTEDSTFSKGAWGPITNSNPDTYFWDLNMLRIASIDYTQDSSLRKLIDVNIFEEYDSPMKSTSMQLTGSGIGDKFTSSIQQALAKKGIPSENLIRTTYNISNATLKDFYEEKFDVTNLKFNPSSNVSVRETSEDHSVIIADNVPVTGSSNIGSDGGGEEEDSSLHEKYE